MTEVWVVEVFEGNSWGGGFQPHRTYTDEKAARTRARRLTFVRREHGFPITAVRVRRMKVRGTE